MNDEKDANFFTFKARMISLISLSAIPFLPQAYRWQIIMAIVFTVLVTFVCEEKKYRKRVAIVCIAGLAAALLIASLRLEFVMQIILWLMCLAGLSIPMVKGTPLEPKNCG